MAADVPTEALDPVAITILFPAVPKLKFPFVAVIFPNVAVNVVVAVTEPGAVTALGRETIAAPVVGDTVTWFDVPETESTLAPPD